MTVATWADVEHLLPANLRPPHASNDFFCCVEQELLTHAVDFIPTFWSSVSELVLMTREDLLQPYKFPAMYVGVHF
jgi:hypothetical protein